MAARSSSNECNPGFWLMSLVLVSLIESMDFYVMSIYPTCHLPYIDVERLIGETSTNALPYRL